ncbi:MAG TPA: hypothetical protein DCS83_06660 [Prevotella sp.]|nr:hypothetical protein [Prevotella sp.]
MIEVKIKDAALRKAAGDMDEFVQVFVNAIQNAIGGELTVEIMQQLNSDQITLLAWNILHGEVMDGGFIQLIHNGYGGFIFINPTDKAFREWGLEELCSLIRHAHKSYNKHKNVIERECSDEEFMVLYEQMSEFDDYDDAFIEHEEQWTSAVAHYIDGYIDNFATIITE